MNPKSFLSNFWGPLQKDSPSEIRGGADKYLSILLPIASYTLETMVSISSSGPGYPLSLPG